ncbi:MAG: hypothetical protein JNN24_00735 [Hyphomicrobium zavarzinii]|jgi:hypothetical protein|uniref:hypothetical protein n=1 Tax=Hyphomicrobium TaxID=81 RepID=UPI001A5EE081|nr:MULTISPECIES: hypothetical protein [Hyphomicrobium]MBL8844269.1 hypothetical protein [Hyphomicrobium zavarzinii]WBT36917.1 hypothetical protein PE058_14790 [Hyphomicrobium sp. DMF-1]
MDIGTIMNTMRDPAGVPAVPQLFQVLAVGTWVFHIAFVHLTLGAAGLAIYAFYKREAGPYWEQMSIAMTKVAKVGVSLLIVLGVAPLLFTQVIYDPQWYTSNVLSAGWAIGFIFTLIAGYCLWFAFYWGNHEGAKRYIGVYAVLSLALFILDGLIMHALAYQAILPDRWMEWYAPGGVVDTSGSKLHAIEWPRYLFIMSLSAPAVGLYLIAYADYFATRSDKTPEYRAFGRLLGRTIAVPGLAVSALLASWWQLDHPAATGLSEQPLGWLLPGFLLVLAGLTAAGYQRLHGYAFLGIGLGVLALLAFWREVVRITYLTPFGYIASDYKVHADWPSLVLFFSTLAGVGGLVGGYYLALLYRAGRVQGTYTAEPPIARLGTAAVAVLVVWIGVFFVYGVAIWIRNALLA